MEEVIEILQGKISLLEDQLAKLDECSAQENGEVMGDILKLEELKQKVSSLAAKRAKLQAMVLWLKEEKQLLGSLISSLQSLFSKSHWAHERLEHDLQTQDAKRQPGQLVALNAQHEQIGNSVLQQLQQLQEASASLCKYIWIPAMGRGAPSCSRVLQRCRCSQLNSSSVIQMVAWFKYITYISTVH